MEGLIKNLRTTYYFGLIAQLLSVAQITKSIPPSGKLLIPILKNATPGY